MNDPFRRGNPLDLPVRPSTSANFDWLAHRRNLFDLRLPETISAKNTGILTMPIRERVALTWSWHERFLESELSLEGRIEVRGRITPAQDCVHLELFVTNRSPTDWNDTEAVVCIRLIAAPDFADRKRNRTYWWTRGSWTRLEPGFPKISLGSQTDRGFIAVESESREYVVGTGWKEVWQICGNDMPHNICIHTDPWLGSIPSGGHARSRGMIVFMKGSREEALDRYLESSFLWGEEQ